MLAVAGDEGGRLDHGDSPTLSKAGTALGEAQATTAAALPRMSNCRSLAVVDGDETEQHRTLHDRRDRTSGRGRKCADLCEVAAQIPVVTVLTDETVVVDPPDRNTTQDESAACCP
jgi:hypothetical protein